MVDALAIKLGDLGDPVSSLSGGNAQKVVFGKWLLTEPGVVLLDISLAAGSGFDVLRAVRPQAPEIDVYVLSNVSAYPCGCAP